MKLKKDQTYSDKHGENAKIDETIASEIRRRAKNKQLPCAVAFDIAAKLDCDARKIGQTTDLMNFRLNKCQLGLFGYTPNKKIVKPEKPANLKLEEAIKSGSANGALACQAAWELADSFKVTKMAVSAACEALGIKIKPCQLGAF